MFRTMLRATLCALLVTVLLWGLLTVHHVSQQSGFASPESLFTLELSLSPSPVLRLTLFGRTRVFTPDDFPSFRLPPLLSPTSAFDVWFISLC